MTTLQVIDRFYSLQGEGCHIGRAAFFIRLYGCPLKCGWCDSADTWHPEFTPKSIPCPSIQELVAEALDSRAEFVVITGGEPLVHAYRLEELVRELKKAGMIVHCTTCGALPGDYEQFHWVSLSPKFSRFPTREAWDAAGEIRIVVEHEHSVKNWEPILERHLVNRSHNPTVWLIPEWSKRRDAFVLSAIVHAVKRKPHFYRAGWQIQKLYHAHRLDDRATSAVAFVPLGGDHERGLCL